MGEKPKKQKPFQVIDSKEKLFEKLEITSEGEISKENIFRKLITLNAVVDKEILGMILPKIENFTDLVVKQQQFISDIAAKQNHITEKAMESFNKTKDIISEILKANPTMDKEERIFLVETLIEMDKLISKHTKEFGESMKKIIKDGLMVGGAVGATLLVMTLKGKGSKND